MQRTTLKRVILANVRALLGIAEHKAGVAQLIRLGFANGTAQRILDETTSIGVDILERLASRLGVEAWQLCVPNLNPDFMPSLQPVGFRWPFRKIDPDVVTSLAGTAAQGVENGLLASLATLGIQPRKPREDAA